MPFDASQYGEPRFAPASDDSLVINEAGPFAPAFVRRGLASRSKQRTSIEVRSEAILMDLDELVLGQGPAEAIRDELSKDTKAIAEPASTTTLNKRKQAAENPGAAWVQKRYGGGRTGFKPANQTIRIGNDSGRLADGWFVRENKTERSYTINAPANRLDPSTFYGTGFAAWIERFRSLMPILRDARALLGRQAFNAAVSQAAKDIHTKTSLSGDAAAVAKLKALVAARRRAIRALFAAGRELLG